MTEAVKTKPAHGGYPAATARASRRPIGYMSPKQLPRIKDPEDESGIYIPMRATPAGNFTLALYAAPVTLRFESGPLTDEHGMVAGTEEADRG